MINLLKTHIRLFQSRFGALAWRMPHSIPSATLYKTSILQNDVVKSDAKSYCQTSNSTFEMAKAYQLPRMSRPDFGPCTSVQDGTKVKQGTYIFIPN